MGTVLSGIDHELVIADDDSPDRTWAVAQELASQNPRIRVLRRTTDRGLSPAVIEGFLSASSDYVGVIDADLQHDPAILPQMIAALDAGAEVAVGSRYVEGGGTGAWNCSRRFQSWVATSGSRFFLVWSCRIRCLDILFCGAVTSTEFVPSSSIRAALRFVGDHCEIGPLEELEEVPYTFRARVAGQSEVVLKVVLSTWDFGGSPLLAVTCPFASSSLHSSVHRERSSTAFSCVLPVCSDCGIGGFQPWLRFLRTSRTIFLIMWTFLDRKAHPRFVPLARVFFSYFGFFLVGLSASTLTFVGLTRAYDTYLHPLQPSKEPFLLALGFQLIAIAVGTVFNYELNSRFTWRDKDVSDSKFSDSKSLLPNDFVSTEENPDQAKPAEHDFRRMPVVVKAKSFE